MMNSNISGVGGNRFRSAPAGDSKRVWTRESVNLNRESKEAFVKTLQDKADISSKAVETQDKTTGHEPRILSANDFISGDNLIATDQNSTLAQELSNRPDEDKSRDNSPTSLILDENGNVASADDLSASEIPSDVVKTQKHRSATIGTFNIEWLGGCPYKNNRRRRPPKRNEADYKKIAGVIKDSGASLLGLQEVVKEEALLKVLKHLPDWGFVISKNKNQKVALIFDKKRVQYDANSIQCLDEMADPDTFNYGNLRPPLSVYMKVDNFDCNFIVVHQKSGFQRDSLEIRNKQSRMMNDWIESYLEKSPDKDLIVMGDFNDFTGSKSLNAIAEGGILRYATGEFGKDDYTNIPHKGTIDHIGYTTVDGGAGDEVKQGSTKTINEKQYPGYTENISDHKPVTVEVNTKKDND